MELSAEEQKDPVAFLLGAFFSPSRASQAAGREYIKRLESRRQDRDLPVSRNSAEAHLAAIREWGTIPASGRDAYLDKITHPTLIVHGNKDVVVAPINALILAQRLPNAQLIVYSDSSHGTQYQHARTFLQHVALFLADAHAQPSEPINDNKNPSWLELSRLLQQAKLLVAPLYPNQQQQWAAGSAVAQEISALLAKHPEFYDEIHAQIGGVFAKP